MKVEDVKRRSKHPHWNIKANLFGDVHTFKINVFKMMI